MTSENDSTVVAFQRPAASGARKHVPNPNWDYLRERFAAGASYRYLASLPEADGASFKTLAKRGLKEGWNDLRQTVSQEVQARAKAELLAGDDPLPDDPDELRATLIERGVKKHVSVAKALQQKSEAAIEFLDDIEMRIRKSLETGVLDPILSGGRLSLIDVVKQFVNTTQTLQGGGGIRYTHDLDTQKSEPKPFVPKFGRRDAPGYEDDDEE